MTGTNYMGGRRNAAKARLKDTTTRAQKGFFGRQRLNMMLAKGSRNANKQSPASIYNGSARIELSHAPSLPTASPKPGRRPSPHAPSPGPSTRTKVSCTPPSSYMAKSINKGQPSKVLQAMDYNHPTFLRAEMARLRQVSDLAGVSRIPASCPAPQSSMKITKSSPRPLDRYSIEASPCPQDASPSYYSSDETLVHSAGVNAPAYCGSSPLLPGAVSARLDDDDDFYFDGYSEEFPMDCDQDGFGDSDRQPCDATHLTWNGQDTKSHLSAATSDPISDYSVSVFSDPYSASIIPSVASHSSMSSLGLGSVQSPERCSTGLYRDFVPVALEQKTGRPEVPPTRNAVLPNFHLNTSSLNASNPAGSNHDSVPMALEQMAGRPEAQPTDSVSLENSGLRASSPNANIPTNETWEQICELLGFRAHGKSTSRQTITNEALADLMKDSRCGVGIPKPTLCRKKPAPSALPPHSFPKESDVSRQPRLLPLFVPTEQLCPGINRSVRDEPMQVIQDEDDISSFTDEEEDQEMADSAFEEEDDDLEASATSSSSAPVSWAPSVAPPSPGHSANAPTAPHVPSPCDETIDFDTPSPLVAPPNDDPLLDLDGNRPAPGSNEKCPGSVEDKLGCGARTETAQLPRKSLECDATAPQPTQSPSIFASQTPSRSAQSAPQHSHTSEPLEGASNTDAITEMKSQTPVLLTKGPQFCPSLFDEAPDSDDE